MKKRIYRSLTIRLCSILLFAFFLWPVIASLTGVFEFETVRQKAFFSSLFIFVGCGCVWLIYIMHTSYHFGQDYISVKKPFLAERKYFVSEFKGWGRVLENVNMYLENKKIVIPLSGSKLIQALSEFAKRNYDSVKERNIEKINCDGLLIHMNKNYTIKIHKDSVSFKKDDEIRTYNWDNFSEISLLNNGHVRFVKMVTAHGLTVNIHSVKCHGGIGFFEFIQQKTQSGTAG